MRIRIRKRGLFKDKRIDSGLAIDEIIIKENLLEPDEESISIFVRGSESSGIINLSEEEAKSLVDSLKGNIRLVSKIRKIRD